MSNMSLILNNQDSSSSVPASFTAMLPFATPSDLASSYELGRELGRGQFGVIRSCTSRSSASVFACKSISKARLRTLRDIQDVVREIRIIKNLSDPIPTSVLRCTDQRSPRCHTISDSITCLHDVVEDNGFVHLVMDLCRGGDLYDRIVRKKCYPEAQAALLMRSLLQILELCHGLGIMHRDLKPENILFVHDSDTSPIKLADFGLALEFSPGEKFSGMAGSAFYMAPEMLRGEYSEEIDMWSAGVILYVLLSGMPPFWQATEQGTFDAIQEGDVNFPPDPWGKISLSAKDLILHLLCIDAKSRLTPAQALKHPWIIHHTKNIKQVHRSQKNIARGRAFDQTIGNMATKSTAFSLADSRFLHKRKDVNMKLE